MKQLRIPFIEQPEKEFSESFNAEEIYTNIMTGELKKLSEWFKAKNEFKAWDYLILEKNK